MRTVFVAVIALAAGIALGFVGSRTLQEPRTQTVVTTEAAPAPATHDLLATIEGRGGSCVIQALGDDELLSHAFTLRRPNSGSGQGAVVGVSAGSAWQSADDCALDVTFKISPRLGFFVVTDDTTDDVWGPFDSAQMQAHGWHLRLFESAGVE